MTALDWSKLPDLVAVALLACAFVSVARRSHTSVSDLWLTGWILVAVHFAAFVFLSAPGGVGNIAQFTGLTALSWAGVLFLWAAVPTANISPAVGCSSSCWASPRSTWD